MESNFKIYQYSYYNEFFLIDSEKNEMILVDNEGDQKSLNELCKFTSIFSSLHNLTLNSCLDKTNMNFIQSNIGNYWLCLRSTEKVTELKTINTIFQDTVCNIIIDIQKTDSIEFLRKTKSIVLILKEIFNSSKQSLENFCETIKTGDNPFLSSENSWVPTFLRLNPDEEGKVKNINEINTIKHQIETFIIYLTKVIDIQWKNLPTRPQLNYNAVSIINSEKKEKVQAESFELPSSELPSCSSLPPPPLLSTPVLSDNADRKEFLSDIIAMSKKMNTCENLEAKRFQISQSMIEEELNLFYDKLVHPMMKSKYKDFIGDLIGQLDFLSLEEYENYLFEELDSAKEFVEILSKINNFLKTYKSQIKFIEQILTKLHDRMIESGKSEEDINAKLNESFRLIRNNLIIDEKNKQKQEIQKDWLMHLPLDQFNDLTTVDFITLKNELLCVEKEFKEKFEMKEFDLQVILEKLREFQTSVVNAQSLDDLKALELDYNFWQTVFFKFLPIKYARIIYEQ